MARTQHIPTPSSTSTPQIFSSFAPAYFTPSTGSHLPYLFRLRGGTTLPADPNADEDQSDPLALPVSYFFVNGPQDSHIKYLTARPVVLYDAAWVMECVLAVKVMGLTKYVVDVEMRGRGTNLSSSAVSSSGSSPIKTTATPSSPMYPELSPTSIRGGPKQPQLSETSNKSQAASAKYLIDFNKNISLDVLSGKVSNLKIPLHCTHSLSQPGGASSSSNHSAKTPLRQADFPMLSPPSKLGKQKRKSPDTSTGASSTTSNKRVKSKDIPAYRLSEVMGLLNEEIREESVLELVAGKRWRVEVTGRSKRLVE